ncbi:hypothetical protein SAMN05421813_10699 [Daejeonella rubra]|uniref:Uncharacterized protein n=1 Tax=Daejeonella rubra TaxID=990371 RepID=A0A1G9QLL5_9SPHI|nr:hypothetical protein SAMN05421813_10699 [Daejeonella rubra]
MQGLFFARMSGKNETKPDFYYYLRITRTSGKINLLNLIKSKILLMRAKR